jgi:predicted nucleotidyltransferase
MDERVAREVAAEVARHPAIAAAWIFGSTARGDAGKDSDLDLAVLLRAGAAGGDTGFLHDLASALERFSATGVVDILVLGQQGPVLRHRVLAEGRLVHDADPDARVEFEGRTIAEYLDWKPTHDIAMRSALSGLRDRLRRASE